MRDLLRSVTILKRWYLLWDLRSVDLQLVKCRDNLLTPKSTVGQSKKNDRLLKKKTNVRVYNKKRQ